MLDIAEELYRWSGRGLPFAVATVVATGGSAPRQPGAALAVDAAGEALGSVSGGCVEGAVYERCQEVLAGGPEAVLERYGYSDEDAFAVGLTCGGVIDILVTPVRAADPARPVVATAQFVPASIPTTRSRRPRQGRRAVRGFRRSCLIEPPSPAFAPERRNLDCPQRLLTRGNPSCGYFMRRRSSRMPPAMRQLTYTVDRAPKPARVH